MIDRLILPRHRRDTSGNRGRAGGHDNQILGLGRCELQEERSLAVSHKGLERDGEGGEGSGILGWCLNAIEWCSIIVANDEIQG